MQDRSKMAGRAWRRESADSIIANLSFVLSTMEFGCRSSDAPLCTRWTRARLDRHSGSPLGSRSLLCQLPPTMRYLKNFHLCGVSTSRAAASASLSCDGVGPGSHYAVVGLCHAYNGSCISLRRGRWPLLTCAPFFQGSDRGDQPFPAVGFGRTLVPGDRFTVWHLGGGGGRADEAARVSRRVTGGWRGLVVSPCPSAHRLPHALLWRRLWRLRAVLTWPSGSHVGGIRYACCYPNYRTCLSGGNPNVPPRPVRTPLAPGVAPSFGSWRNSAHQHVIACFFPSDRRLIRVGVSLRDTLELRQHSSCAHALIYAATVPIHRRFGGRL